MNIGEKLIKLRREKHVSDEQINISLTTREDNHFDVEVVREGGYVERIPAGIYIYQAIESVNVVKKNLINIGYICK